MRVDVFFCEYSNFTGYPRHCDITNCFHYNNGRQVRAPGKVFKQMDDYNTNVPNGVGLPKKEIPPRPTNGGKAGKKWWDQVLAEVDGGRDPHEVAKEYGVTYNELRRTQGARERASRLAAVRQSFESQQPPKAKKDQGKAAPAKKPPEAGATAEAPDLLAFVDKALIRSRNILNSIDRSDGIILKIAVLIMVSEIITMLDGRLESEEAE